MVSPDILGPKNISAGNCSPENLLKKWSRPIRLTLSLAMAVTPALVARIANAHETFNKPITEYSESACKTFYPNLFSSEELSSSGLIILGVGNNPLDPKLGIPLNELCEDSNLGGTSLREDIDLESGNYSDTGFKCGFDSRSFSDYPDHLISVGIGKIQTLDEIISKVLEEDLGKVDFCSSPKVSPAFYKYEDMELVCINGWEFVYLARDPLLGQFKIRSYCQDPYAQKRFLSE